jgi:integrase/recombinase XerD
MTDSSRLGPWVRRFLLEHLINERNLSRGTQRSYRDTLALLIPFVARQSHKRIDDLNVIHVAADSIRRFLAYLEDGRTCAVSTRNQRLAAIHSLARFVALHSPEHIAWCGEICAIPFKKCTKKPVTYLEKAEIDALLAAPNLQSAQGRRDHLLLWGSSTTRAPALTKPPRSSLEISTSLTSPTETFRG